MRAVIMAGGKGTRINELTKDEIPKPMLRICGKPVLEYQINTLKSNGINEIIIIVGHLGNKIIDYFGDGKDLGVSISYIKENHPLGTFGALYYLKEVLNDDFVFVYGDLIFDIDLNRMCDFHKTNKALITLFSHPNNHPFDSDLVLVDKNSHVVGIDKKGKKRNYDFYNLVNAGIFILSNKVLDCLNELNYVDFEKDIILINVEKNERVLSYKSSEYVKDCGTKNRFSEIERDLKFGIPYKKSLINKQKAIFLDRDGTINKLIPYLKNKDQFELIKGVSKAIKRINESGYLCIVITNQPVIARGEATLEDLNDIHKKMETLLAKNNCYVDEIYFCPHHPDSGYPGEIKQLKINCNCRKPKIGMLLDAQKKFNIDFQKSYIIGDSYRDVQTGKNANVYSVLIRTNNQEEKCETKPDYIANSLKEAVDYILFKRSDKHDKDN